MSLQAVRILCLFLLLYLCFSLFLFIVFSCSRCVIILQQIAVKPCFARPRKLLQNGRHRPSDYMQSGTSIGLLSLPPFGFMHVLSLHFKGVIFCILFHPISSIWSSHILCPLLLLYPYFFLFLYLYFSFFHILSPAEFGKGKQANWFTRPFRIGVKHG